MSSRGMETVNHYLSQGYPATGVAMAMSRLSRELYEAGDNDALGGLLHCMWNVVARQLVTLLPAEKAQTEFAVCAAFLEQYFKHRGNWSAIEQHLYQTRAEA